MALQRSRPFPAGFDLARQRPGEPGEVAAQADEIGNAQERRMLHHPVMVASHVVEGRQPRRQRVLDGPPRLRAGLGPHRVRGTVEDRRKLRCALRVPGAQFLEPVVHRDGQRQECDEARVEKLDAAVRHAHARALVGGLDP